VHPLFTFLRKDPQFQALVEKIWGPRLIGKAA
jgi:hypothetical protein